VSLSSDIRSIAPWATTPFADARGEDIGDDGEVDGDGDGDDEDEDEDEEKSAGSRSGNR
jgi:hypothetical protein